uniref:Type I cytokine receptor cytokine-binding domain-containing protein n=1 Tax=Neolamprologus brichardi TaxID=32507 RepID=A0A3Q4MP92_NEOBR
MAFVCTLDSACPKEKQGLWLDYTITYYQLPEPTDVTYRWDDQFQVNVSWSWKKPDNHPKNCTTYYHQTYGKLVQTFNNFTVKYFTEDKHSDHWNISIQAVDPVCRKKSRPVNKTIKTSKRRTELVTDFRCSLESERTKCFWKPVNESVKLNIMIPLPKMNIAEDKGNLYLTWEHRGPAVGKLQHWFCVLLIFQTLHTKGPSLEIPYNKNCQYKFQYSVQTDQYCIPLSSDLSEVITHGENRSPDEMLTVIAIVVPIILSVSVILSCYCFQRNREIFCPRIPDPSTIFKEMMMTGNRDSKPIPGNLYTPVPEPTEHIILVSENMIPEEAS